MKCRYCKDTGMVELLSSRVACTDCPPPVAPAANVKGWADLWHAAGLSAPIPLAKIKCQYKNYTVVNAQIGDPHYIPVGVGLQCNNMAMGYYCTRGSGHLMPHAAHANKVTLATWEDDI